MNEDFFFDMKTLTPVDAQFVRQWQMNWLKNHQFASPKEISIATQKAIKEGQIKIGIQR